MCLLGLTETYPIRMVLKEIPHKQAVVCSAYVLGMVLLIGGLAASYLAFPTTGFAMLAVPASGLALIFCTTALIHYYLHTPSRPSWERSHP